MRGGQAGLSTTGRPVYIADGGAIQPANASHPLLTVEWKRDASALPDTSLPTFPGCNLNLIACWGVMYTGLCA